MGNWALIHLTGSGDWALLTFERRMNPTCQRKESKQTAPETSSDHPDPRISCGSLGGGGGSGGGVGVGVWGTGVAEGAGVKTVRVYMPSYVKLSILTVCLISSLDSRRSSFLMDLLMSMIFSQMYLFTLDNLCVISALSAVS